MTTAQHDCGKLFSVYLTAMRTFLSRSGRLVALFVTLAMLNASIAMAAYVCPKAERQLAAIAEMAGHAHMAGMHHDAPEKKPAPCVQQHAGNKQAVELATSSADPAPPAVISVQPLTAAPLPVWQRLAAAAALHDHPSHAPPFLRTQRLRI